MDAEALLQELHIASIELLLDRVKSGEATASELSVARQLLKDNGIDQSPREGSPVTQLAVVMPFEDPEASISQAQ
jgi:hypothetical protein